MEHKEVFNARSKNDRFFPAEQIDYIMLENTNINNIGKD